MGTEKNQVAVLKPGTVFEKYTIVKLLGRGGMGAVYLVRHNVLDSLFALKVLSPNVAEENKQFVDRFIREAKLACKIRHPNLIAVHDAGRNPDNGMYYIVQDYVPGGSVRELLKREPRLYPQDALRIITQVAEALVAAHAHHMVHRDIKPDNIMFAADGTAKLADLGIAKSTDEQDTMLTVAAAVFGTPAYMSPEQAMDSSKVDSRADIYSLGIVFYEMLAGQRPYRGDGTMAILSQVISDTEVPDIRKICPAIPPDLAELISAMTAKKLSDRIPDPETLLRRLKAIHVPDTPPPASIGETASGDPDVTVVTRVNGGGNGGGAPGQADVTMQTLVKHPDPQEPSGAASSAGPDRGGGDPAHARGDGSLPEQEPERTIPTLVKEGPHPGKSTLEDPDATVAGGETGRGNVPAEQGDVPSGTPENGPPELPPGQGKADPPRRRKTALRLICAALVVVIVLCLSWGWLKGRKKIERPPAASPVAKEKGPAKPLPSTSGKKPKPSPAAADVGTAGGTGAVPRTEKTGKSAPEPAHAETKSVPPVSSEPGPAHISGQPSAAAENGSDPLARNQIVLLAGDSAYTRSLKEVLGRAFGQEKTVSRPAESMREYWNELKAIEDSSPKPKVLIIAFPEYADVSISNFDTRLRHHAVQLRDKLVPSLFVLFPNGEDASRQRLFNGKVEELCKFNSIPLLKYGDKQFESDLQKLVKKLMAPSD